MIDQEIPSFDGQVLNYKGYMGDPLIKRAGVQIQWTAEMVQEYFKCKNDPIYFIKKYIKVININDGLVNLNLYPYQEDIVLSAANNRNTIVCTSRQAGKTTAMVGFTLWYILFNPDPKQVGILANKATVAREVLKRVTTAYRHLPRWMQLGVKELNKGTITFENESKVHADATKSDSVRGFSFNVLMIDEAAHIDSWDDFYTSVYPTITSGKESKIILVSTPNGLNHFYKFWQESIEERNDFNRIEVSWQKVPGRDEKWRKNTLESMGNDLEKFAQEFECRFQGSSGTLIAGWKLKEMFEATPISVYDDIRIYEQSIKDRIYSIVADVSEGKGLDYSAFHVIDITDMPYKQVASYRSNMVTPDDYAGVIFRMAKMYNNAYVLVENNNMGDQVAKTIAFDNEYEFLLYTSNIGGRNGKKVNLMGGQSYERGIKTTQVVKQNGCSLLKLLIEQNQLIIQDGRTIRELNHFSRKKKSYEAEEGHNDDTVMGLVLFAWLSNQEYFKELTDINTVSRLKDLTDQQMDENLSLVGYTTNGLEEMKAKSLLEEQRAYWGIPQNYVNPYGYDTEIETLADF